MTTSVKSTRCIPQSFHFLYEFFPGTTCLGRQQAQVYRRKLPSTIAAFGEDCLTCWQTASRNGQTEDHHGQGQVIVPIRKAALAFSTHCHLFFMIYSYCCDMIAILRTQ